MVGWHLTRRPHSTRDAAFSGDGARVFGGRWNSPGVAVIYSSATLSLAALESLAHADRRRFEREYAAFRFEIRDEDVLTVTSQELPRSWQARPVSLEARSLGDGWVSSSASVALSIPSVVVPLERNLLLNPAHPFFGAVVISEPILFTFDDRRASG